MTARAIGPVTTAATTGAAAATILVWLVEELTRRDIPSLVEGAIVVLLTAAGGLLVPSRGGDHASG